MRRTLFASLSLSLALLAPSCTTAPPACGAGECPDAATPDAALDGGTDAALDAGRDAATGCIQATVGTWQLEYLDDVSVSYLALLSPTVGGAPYALYISMDRYGGVEYVGTFPLDSGDDTNRSTCAHCVAAYTGAERARGFFVDRGVLELGVDPFTMQLDATVTNLRLIEVTIGGETLMSTPVPGGDCIEVADFSVDQRFAPPGWHCSVDLYGDGAACNCTCGIPDPDCDGTRPPVDCGPDTICEARPTGVLLELESFCAATCDRASGDACATGACVVDYNFQSYCDTTEGLVSSVAVGETCGDGARYCAPVDSSFFDGICDTWDRADGTCRPVCASDADCNAAAFERCYTLVVGTDTAYGFCSPRYPAAWTCSGAQYEDGTTCDCACGVPDPDCDLPGAPVAGCAAGELCLPMGECASIPANDTCEGAPALTLGTVAAPAHTAGTTRGARNDYSTPRLAGGCIEVEEDGPDVTYEVTLTAGQTLEVRGLAAESNLSLYLLGPGTTSICDAMATHCVAGVEVTGYGEAEVLTYTATASGTYYLVVDSFASLFYGDFVLDASVTP